MNHITTITSLLAEASAPTSWPDVAMYAIGAIFGICIMITLADAWPWQK
jgi:hypothetical protein